MTDHPRLPPTASDDDAEVLAAYLDGLLDTRAEVALEERLAAEPELAGRLEAIREVRERLAGVGVEPPAGYAGRLREGLAAARAEEAAPASLDAARARADARRSRWPVLGTVAAAVLALAVVGGIAATTFGDRDRPRFAAMDDAESAPDDAPAALDVEEEAFAPDAAGEVAEDTDFGDLDAATTDGQQRRQAVSEPSVVDSGVRLSDDAAARAHLGATEEAASLLGTPEDEAHDLAAAFSVAIRRAEPFTSGAAPSACLDTVTSGAPGAAVPAYVEAVVYDGADALAYVLAVQSAGAGRLDRAEAWVVEPTSCATRLFLDVTPQ